MADAKMITMKVTSKGTMPVVEYDVTAYEAVPQTGAGSFDKSLWEAGDQVPADAKAVPNNDSGVSIDKSIDRMAAETKIYQSF